MACQRRLTIFGIEIRICVTKIGTRIAGDSAITSQSGDMSTELSPISSNKSLCKSEMCDSHKPCQAENLRVLMNISLDRTKVHTKNKAISNHKRSQMVTDALFSEKWWMIAQPQTLTTGQLWAFERLLTATDRNAWIDIDKQASSLTGISSRLCESHKNNSWH